MRHILALLFAAAAASTSSACSTSATTETNYAYHDSTVVVSGPLRISATDQLAMPGVLWALPSATVTPGKVTVAATRYGSLCVYDVSGHAAVASGVIALTVIYGERLTSCTGEIRSLTYHAEITVPSGEYDVVIAHEENARHDVVRTQHVTVP